MDETISSFTRSNDRAEHMAYLTSVAGLSPETAALLYRAERLQESGQYEAALVGFERVLAASPNCVEARENARITVHMFQAQQQRKELQRVPEPQTVTTATTGYTVTEMDIEWYDKEFARPDGSGHLPSPTEAAYDAARAHLAETGHKNSLIRLLHNEELEDGYDEYSMNFKRGVASFRVTLIPDQEVSDALPKESSKVDLLCQRVISLLEHAPLPTLDSGGTTMMIGNSNDGSSDTDHSSTVSSRFADAEP